MKSLPEIRNSTLKQIKEKISYMLTKIKSSLLLINLNFQVSTCIFIYSIKASYYEGTSSQLYRLHNFCSYEKKAWEKFRLVRVQHRYHRVQGFESHTSLNFFHSCKSCLYNCDDIYYNFHIFITSSSSFHGFIMKLIQQPAPSWLVSLHVIGRALHCYRRGQGFESHTSLKLFMLSFRNCKSCFYNCDDLPFS